MSNALVQSRQLMFPVVLVLIPMIQYLSFVMMRMLFF